MTTERPTAQKITDDLARLAVLPKHFGRLLVLVEHNIYNMMGRLCPDYSGAYWNFYELSNGGFYMAPDLEPLNIYVAGNGFSDTMSADAAGITACLFTFSHMSFTHSDEVLAEHYHRLRDFALGHEEHSKIFAAID